MAKEIPYLDVQNLTKSFGSLVLFENISFSIAERQRVGLIAKNGTGKSTLLSILAGKESYDSGEIILQARVSLDEKETPDSLAAKIHQLEQAYFPVASEQVLLSQN